ncbi:FAD-binding oxidoreductase [Streptomyces olivaceus]|uniref:FAD-binding oxidoreductase n=1 Tax=Streptomyces olivaceus TaxID=47716 RepID=UPI001CCA80AC|nr:FAD-binding protein [Streptomyces olivaceus]MBZ6286165.1 FAD-binding protein [Streptomyces olivaceus]
MTVNAPDWGRLSSQLQGDLVLPADPGYELAKQLHLAEFDRFQPQGIAYCETADDVAAAVGFAVAHGIPVHPRSGAHSLTGSSSGSGLVVDTSRIAHVRTEGSTVRFGPGLLSVDGVTALRGEAHQLVTGTFPTVAAAGFVTGGGIGLQSRTFGLAADRLLSATVVLADGRIVRASEKEEPDLFWALRGGGAGFGVVVEFESEAIHAPRGVHFTTAWAWQDAHRVLEAWQEWIVAAPREIGSSVLVVLPEATEDAVPVVQIAGVCWGARDVLDDALGAFVSATGATPEATEVEELPYADVLMRVYGCEGMSPDECHRVGHGHDARIERIGTQRERHRVFDQPLKGAALSRALEVFDTDRRAGHTRYLWMNTANGAVRDVGRSETAFWHRDAEYLVGYANLVPDGAPQPEEEQAMRAWVDRGFDVLDPLSTGGAYVNFPDPALSDAPRAYFGENLARLRSVKAAYDSGDVFAFAGHTTD